MREMSSCDFEKKLSNAKNKLQTQKNYIFGAGRLGEKIFELFQSKGIIVDGFIDNAKKGQTLKGQKVFSLNEVKKTNTNIIIASINYLFDIEKQLSNNMFDSLIPFDVLGYVYPELQSFNQAFWGIREDFIKHREKYEKVRELLDDDISRTVLDALVAYRKELDIKVYQKPFALSNKQYFEEFLPKNKVFVDGGSFDGQNVIDYREFVPNYKHIYAFEPDKDSMLVVKNKLKDYSNVTYLPYGISQKEEVLRFNPCADSGSCFDSTGSIECKCVALDDIVKEDSAYIKLDIEGAELDAIKGATRLIRNGSLLAVSVYHKPQDIWQIILYINEINPNYVYKLRHYTSSVFETVLYAIPRSKNG